MRMIDGDELKTQLYESIMVNADMDCLDFLRVESLIDAQPTAYNVDKVVEQLEEKDSDCEDFGTCNYCQRNWCPRTLIDRDAAIKIVKAGGVNHE